MTRRCCLTYYILLEPTYSIRQLFLSFVDECIVRYVYVLRSVKWVDKTYVGVTGDPVRRLTEHNQSKCSYTKQYKPWKIVHLEEFDFDKDAYGREKQLKKWSRKKKKAFIAGDLEMLKFFSKRKK